MKTKASILCITLALILLLSVAIPWPALAEPPLPPSPATLDPTTIPKYVNQLDGPPPVYVPRVIRGRGGEVIRHEYAVLMQSFEQQILPTQYANGTPTGFGPTPVWGYGGLAKDALTGKMLGFVRNSPGPTFEATRGIPVYVNWQNRIWSSHMFAVDPTLHWANPNNFSEPTDPFEPYPPGYPEAQWPVPLIPHLHGGEVQSTYDGHPEAWFTINGIQGPAYNTARPAKGGNTAVFVYPNEQPPTTLWYHDHALGITRLNVMSGLAGFYLLRDTNTTRNPVAPLLPNGKYEMPLVIQDRIFNEDGTMYFHTVGNSPDDHPYWVPEFFGNVTMVNGKVWPNMNVDQGQYRFRLLDGSNARFYNLSLQVGSEPDDFGNPTVWGEVIPFIQIGSDGGYLNSSVPLNNLIIAPGERADILVDFTGYDSGTTVILRNDAYAPFKGGSKEGDPPGEVGQIMQFTVTDNPGFAPQELPDQLNQLFIGDWPTLPDEISEERILPLVEVMSPPPEEEPLEVLLNGQKWGADISELPVLGSTEEWVILNPTEDTHPIHLHLVQFQLVYRQALEDPAGYLDARIAQQGVEGPPWPLNHTVIPLNYSDWLDGDPIPPNDNELGWKDTIQANPGQITVLRIRFAPIDPDYDPEYPFDATVGPGYVWHCHILDHEDNEMMRPFLVVNDADDE